MRFLHQKKTLILFLLMGFNAVNAQEIFLVDSIHYPPPMFDPTIMDSVTVRRDIDIGNCISLDTPGFTHYLGAYWIDAIVARDVTFIDREDIVFSYTFLIPEFPSQFDDGTIGLTSSTLINPWTHLPYAPEINPTGIAAVPNVVAYGTAYIVGGGVSLAKRSGDSSDLTDGDEINYISDLPPQYHGAGQMTLHKENFYYPSVNNELIKLKARPDTFWLESVGLLPDTLVYGGLFTVPHTCDSSTTYLAHRGDTSTTFYVLDVETADLFWHCEMPGYNAFSVLYPGEKDMPICDPYIDLVADNDAILHRFDTICSGTVSLLDNNIQLSHPMEYDSIVVEILNPQDGSNELVFINSNPTNVWLAGNNTHRLTINTTGFTKRAAFLSALADLTYTNNTQPPTLGERIIQVTAYHPYYPVDSALIFLLLDSGELTAQTDTESVSCFGENDGSVSITPENGSMPYVVTWEDGLVAMQRNNLIAGDYELTVSDALGCYLDMEVNIPQPDTLTVTISSPQDTICGQSGTLFPMISGGTAPFEILWNNTIVSDTLQNAGIGIHEVLVTDENGCEASANYELFPADTLIGNLSLSLCAGEIYEWQGQTFTQDTNFCAGLTSVDGCDSLFCLDLVFQDTFFLAESFTLCSGESIELNGTVFTQDTIAVWTMQSEYGCDSTYQAIITVNAPMSFLSAEICADENYPFNNQLLNQSGQYVDTFPSASGCDSLVVLDLEVRPVPSPLISSTGSLCADGEVILNTTFYEGYLWSNGATIAQTLATDEGIYQLTVTDDFGCTGAAEITLNAEPFTVDWELIQPPCLGDLGQLVIDDISGLQGDFKLTLDDKEYAVPGIIDELPTGSYIASIDNGSGCAIAIEFTVNEPPTYILDLPEELTVVLGDSVQLQPILNFQADTVIWQPPMDLSCTDCLMPFAKPTTSLRYALFTLTENGCPYSEEIFVRVETEGLYVPNAFSPNNDGVNDEFTFYLGKSVQSVEQFSVFNRWGGLVFEGEVGNWEWNGMVNGQAAPDGVYAYSLKWIDFARNELILKGEILLIRR